MKISLLHLAVTLLAFSLPASAASYYVSKTGGSNSNPGTAAQPFLTIQKGIDVAVAGDTIFVRALDILLQQMVYTERLTFTKSGTAVAPITLRNDPAYNNLDGSPAYPAVDQTGVTPPNGLTGLLNITNCSYITVEGLEFENYETADQAKTPAGISISGSGTGIRLVRNKVHHIYQDNAVLNNAQANGFGIAIYGTNATNAIDQLVLDSNEVYDLRTGQSESVTLNGNVTNFQVINNLVHDCNNIGIDFIGYEQGGLSDTVDFARNGTVSGNEVYNVDSQYNPGYGGNFAGSFPTQDDRNATRAAPGLYVDGGASIIFEHNFVHECNIGVSFSSEHSGKVTSACILRDSLLRTNHVGGLFIGGATANKGGTLNCTISNNTLYKNDTENVGGGSVAIQHYVTGTTITQNIFVCSTGNQFILKSSTDGTFTDQAINWNLYSGTANNNLEFIWNHSSQGSFSAWKTASSQDANSLFVASPNGLFTLASPVNPADFALISTSPAVNAGDPAFTPASGETDYFVHPRISGVHVDIGMSEWPSGPQTTVQQPAGTALQSGTSTVNFGTVVLPANSVKTFTVKNTGSSDITSLTLGKDGTNAADYTLGNLSSPPPVAPGNSVTFDVTFTPAAAGTRTANLRVNSNDALTPVFTVKLTGLAVLAPAITTQPQPKTVNPQASVTFTVAATGTAPLSYQWRKAMVNIPNATATSYTIAHVVETDQAAYDVVVTGPGGTATSNPAQLNVNDPVSFTTQPTSVSAAVGTGASFSVVAAGTGPFTYQWRKNAVNIAGATASSYNIPSVLLTSSGTYSVVVHNIVGSMTSANAVLSVADTATKTYKLPTGATAVMTASYAGSITGFNWLQNGNPLPADSRYTGGTTKTLTITGLRVASPDDSGTYTCDLTIASGNLTTTANLIVYNAPPEITLPPGVPHIIAMPTAIVGGTYPAFQIPYNSSDPLKTPTLFAATGLPAGLKLDTATGIITGKPAVALTADKEYAIHFTVSNAKGSSGADASLLLKALPYGTAGVFTGPLARESSLNKNLGGRFDLTVNTTGTYTARTTLGITAYSVVGVLEADVTGSAKPHGSFTFNRTGALPLTVSFDIDSANHALINGDVTDQTLHAAFNGWRNKWGSVMPLAEQYDLKTYLGYYTLALDPAVPSTTPPTTPAEVQPQGAGYGSFTVATNGTLTSAGKLPDGTAWTCATFCGSQGQVMVYQALYSNLGSLLGTLDITQGTNASYVPLYGDNTLAATLTWLRPATATHVYKTGFGPIDITASGGRYVPPVAPALLFGVTDDGSTPNAHLVFTDGGISGTSTDATGTQTSPNVNVRIRAGGAVVIAPPNPRLTTLAITQASGFFTGKATLVDPNPLAPSTNITRTPVYYGIIIRDSGVMRGYGFFLLPRRPNAAGETVATTDQLSGQVVLEKSP